MKVLVTGGAGFIGSHTVVELLNDNREVVIVDNFVNSKPIVLDRIRKITGKDFKFYEVDLLDKAALSKVFDENKIDAVIHFAGLKAVGESVQQPIRYYHNNITGTLILAEVMAEHNVKKIVFSSSATVYGNPNSVPIKETFPLSTTNPYGETKLEIERIFKDITKSDKAWGVSILRYFNPIGAHISGLIGEDPKGLPNNLLPYVSQVASGKLECLSVFGDDYNTPDGTGVRDYIHVVDLAKAHLKALDWVVKTAGIDYFNIGTGNGYSVFEVIKAYEQATGKKVNFKVVARRPGDIGECYADASKALNILGWKAEKDINQMCTDAARWQEMNPNGYEI